MFRKKRRHVSTCLHGVIFCVAIILLFTAFMSLNPAFVSTVVSQHQAMLGVRIDGRLHRPSGTASSKKANGDKLGRMTLKFTLNGIL
jgi:hypothetical protein